MKKQMLYCNPVPYLDGLRRTNPDPHVLRWCGRWYCYSSDTFDANGVRVSVSEDLVHWTDLGFCVPHPAQKHFWAPAVIYLNGVFYMYYSAVPLDSEDDHDEHLMLATATRPEGPFHWKKTFFEEFSIDAHPLLWQGKLYLFYSVNNWIGTDETAAGTCILVDELLTPDTLAGHPRPVVTPSLPQEIFEKNRFGDGRDWYTIEGAATLTRSDKLWVMYSANCFLHEDYFVGVAAAPAKSDLMEMAFQKCPSAYVWKPLLKRSASTEGTGHNTVTKAPDLVGDWIVYHGRRMAEPRDVTREQREMYIDPLYRNADTLFCLGPTDTEQPAPALPLIKLSDLKVSKDVTLCAAPACYVAELWLSAKRQHTGIRYSLHLWQTDEENYLELELHSGKKSLEIARCRDGIRSVLQRSALPDGFAYPAPHLLRIERNFGNWRITLNELLTLAFSDSFEAEGHSIRLLSFFSELTVQSFALTQAADLSGKALAYISMFYTGITGEADTDGLRVKNCTMQFRCQEDTNYSEELQLRPCGAEARLTILRDGAMCAAKACDEHPFSVYHHVRDAREQWIVDGVPSAWQTMDPDTGHRMELYNLTITEYRFAKK